MQRPMMDITYLDDVPASAASRPMRLTRLVFRAIWRGVRSGWRVLMYDPLARVHLRGGRFRNEDGSPLSRFVRGLAYRMAFLPILAALAACAIVYSATHPLPVTGGLDPASAGIYFDSVTVVAEDGARLDAWLVPVLDARRVIDEKELVLRDKHPAALLVHDFGNRREQMLQLVKPLHDAGFVVMVLSTRGCGTSQSRGQTFGLRESLDVKAAVEALRRRQFVDPERVAVVGVGTGANAALLVASSDSRLAALVLAAPVNGFDQVIAEQVVPQVTGLGWMRPLCKWTFEIGYEVDGEELNLARYNSLLANKNVMTLSGNSSTEDFTSVKKQEQIREFLVTRAEEKNLKRVGRDERRVAGTGNR